MFLSNNMVCEIGKDCQGYACKLFSVIEIKSLCTITVVFFMTKISSWQTIFRKCIFLNTTVHISMQRKRLE